MARLHSPSVHHPCAQDECDDNDDNDNMMCLSFHLSVCLCFLGSRCIPLAPHHLHSPTMAAASQATLYDPPVPTLGPAPPCSPCNDCNNMTTTTTWRQHEDDTT